MATSTQPADPVDAEQNSSEIIERVYTADELLVLPNRGDNRYALKKGKLTMMSPAGSKHGLIASRIGARLYLFVDENGHGAVFAAETGFKLESDPDTVLAPDAAFVAAERLPAQLPAGYFPGAPDLAVEVVSPGDRAAELQVKVQAWLHHGTKLVWIVEPKTETVSIYRLDGSVTVLRIGDVLNGEALLPGFQFELNKLFA